VKVAAEERHQLDQKTAAAKRSARALVQMQVRIAVYSIQK